MDRAVGGTDAKRKDRDGEVEVYRKTGIERQVERDRCREARRGNGRCRDRGQDGMQPGMEK